MAMLYRKRMVRESVEWTHTYGVFSMFPAQFSLKH